MTGLDMASSLTASGGFLVSMRRRLSYAGCLLLSYLPAALVVAVVVAVCAATDLLRWPFVLAVTAAAGHVYLSVVTRHHKLHHRGILVTQKTQPALMSLVEEVMRRAGVGRLDGVWIQAGGNASALVGRRDWLWRRHVGVVIGLLTVVHLSGAEMEAVLAHEAGHLRDSNRLRMVLCHRRDKARSRLGRRRSRLSTPYWRWLLGVTREYGLDSERSADAFAVGLCGPDAVATALQRTREVAVIHEMALSRFVRPWYQRGLAPPSLMEAYETIWKADITLIADRVEQSLNAPVKPEDTHPGLSERTQGRRFEFSTHLRGDVSLLDVHQLDRRSTHFLTRRESKFAVKTVPWSALNQYQGDALPPA